VLLIPCKIHTRIIAHLGGQCDAWQTSASVRCIWSSLQVLILICESSWKALFSDILLPTDSDSISCGLDNQAVTFVFFMNHLCKMALILLLVVVHLTMF
jgi:hypothetical protein